MEEEFESMEMDMEEATAIEDVAEEDYTDPVTGQIVQFVKGKYSKAETARQLDEERWIQAYRNYRGIYGPDVQFTEAEKSRVFIIFSILYQYSYLFLYHKFYGIITLKY